MTDRAMGFSRSDTSFVSRGTRCAAWWYEPEADRSYPVVVMAHGFGGTRGMRLDAYAERFASAGYGVLLFDYRSFGDSEGSPRQVLGILRQLADWRAAVDHARSLPGADPSRMVLWGTSLSGGHVLTLASRGEPVAAVVAQVPHVSGVAASLAVGPVMSARLAVEAFRDLLRLATRRSPHYLPSSGRPGEVAAMTSPDTRPGLERMVAESRIEEPSRDVAARVILQMPLYSPGRRVRRIQVPTLIQVGLRDAVTPARVALRTARRISRGQVVEYDAGHFDLYVAPLFDVAVKDQLTFLHRVVPTRHDGT